MSKIGFRALGAVWLFATVTGLQMLWAFDNTPGASPVLGQSWPEGATLARSTDRPTLVLFAHPRCPCTSSTIAQLTSVVKQCGARLRVVVYTYRPAKSTLSWDRTGNRRAAVSIPGVQVISDPGGVEARRFHALTSGQAFLYDRDGQLLFSGGLTGARGHSTENPGADAIVSWTLSGKAAVARTPVFGCSLIGIGSVDERD